MAAPDRRLCRYRLTCSPVAAAEPSRLRSAWAAFRRSSRKPANALLQADHGCKIYDRCAADRSLRQRLQGGGYFNHYPPIAGCAGVYRKTPGPFTSGPGVFFSHWICKKSLLY
ncbi:hypothetical protein EMIT048CA2_260073 [Pseudomonas chlororaphis]